MDRKSFAIRFVQGWRRFQERYRVVSQSYSSEISLLELSILIETQIEKGRSRAELARLFSVTPQAVSVASRKLLDLGFLSEVQGKSDARRWDISLTPSGSKELKGIDREANEILDQMSSHLSHRELNRLVRLLSRMEEYFPNERAALRKIDHPLRGPIRTFTRGFGLLGRSAFGVSGVSVLEWHLLAALSEDSREIYLVDLAERFQCRKNALSMFLSRLEKDGLIVKRSPSSGDLRKRPLELARKGKMRLEEIYERAHDLLTRSLSSLRDAEAEEVCALFESFVGIANLQFEVKVSLQVRPIASSRDGTQELGVYLGKRLIGKLPEGMKDSLAEADIIELFGS